MWYNVPENRGDADLNQVLADYSHTKQEAEP